MKKLFTSILILIFFQLEAQTDVSINPNITWNGECSMAINPTNPQNLCVAWMKITSVFPYSLNIVTSRSTDGGQTWSTPLVLPHFGTYNSSADPSFAVKNDGTFMLCYIDYKATKDSGAVYFVKSNNGGLSWSAPVKTIDGAFSSDKTIDRPWMAIDNSGGPYNGNIYIVTKSIRESPYPHYIRMTKSTNGGLSWSVPKHVDDSIPSDLVLNSMGVPCVSADGKLRILYASYAPAKYLFPRFVYAQSTDGGNTLTYHQVAIIPSNAGLAATDTLYQPSYHIAANPINANNLIVSGIDNRNGDPDVLVMYSNDGGQTFSNVVRVNDDAIGNGKGQDMSWADFSPSGTYCIAWRDRRNGASGQYGNSQLFVSYSKNGGQNFAPNIQLSTGSSPALPWEDGVDFLGIAASDSCIHVAWPDYRNNSNTQIYSNKYCSANLTSIAGHINTPLIEFYPNPAEHSVIIKLKSDDFASYEILGVDGRKIEAGNLKRNNELSVDGLNTGLYILIIKTENQQSAHRFIKR